MNAQDIRSLNERMQEKMLEAPNVVAHEAGFNSLALSLFAEMAAQLAEANENQPSLRDQFAMAAMTGLLSDPTSSGPKGCATAAYLYADAMMEARK